MSSLMVSNNLDIMMLELAVQKLFLPKTSVFDSVVTKKITVMFRMLDLDWTSLEPRRADCVAYTGGSRRDDETDFHGGKSVVFAIPTDSLNMRIEDVDVQIHVSKEIAKYFQVDPNSNARGNVGVAFANVDRLFNGITKDLRERDRLKDYFNCFHKRQPISRSLRETYDIVDEERRNTGATIGIYARLSYFGKSVITEIERDRGLWNERRWFYAREETNETSPYRCRESERSELASPGCWDDGGPPRGNELECRCDEMPLLVETERADDRVEEKIHRTDSTDTGKAVREAAERGRERMRRERSERVAGKTGGKGESGKRKRSVRDGVKIVEGIDKGGGKSYVDRSQRVRRREKINSPEKGEAEKSTSTRKSTDGGGNVRRLDDTRYRDGPVIAEKSPSSGLRRNIESGGPEVSREGGGRKLRSHSTERKTSGKPDQDAKDRRTIGKSVIGVKPSRRETRTDLRESRASNEYAKLLEQLRKRRRGIVATVGIDEKKPRNCRNETVAPEKPNEFPSPHFCHDPRFIDPEICHYSIAHRCPLTYSETGRTDYCQNFCKNLPEMRILAIQG